MSEEFVIYIRCGREIQKMIYCIYCGSPLSEQRELSKIRALLIETQAEGFKRYLPRR